MREAEAADVDCPVEPVQPFEVRSIVDREAVLCRCDAMQAVEVPDAGPGDGQMGGDGEGMVLAGGIGVGLTPEDEPPGVGLHRGRVDQRGRVRGRNDAGGQQCEQELRRGTSKSSRHHLALSMSRKHHIWTRAVPFGPRVRGSPRSGQDAGSTTRPLREGRVALRTHPRRRPCPPARAARLPIPRQGPLSRSGSCCPPRWRKAAQ